MQQTQTCENSQMHDSIISRSINHYMDSFLKRYIMTSKWVLIIGKLREKVFKGKCGDCRECCKNQ